MMIMNKLDEKKFDKYDYIAAVIELIGFIVACGCLIAGEPLYCISVCLLTKLLIDKN